MNTQRLDLPCSSSFSRKETPSLGRSISLDNSYNNNKPIERKTGGCSLKQSIKLPPLATTRGNKQGFSWNNDSNNRGKKSLKRLAEENKDESCLSRVKKRQRSQTDDDNNRSFWFEQKVPALPFSLTCSGDDDDEEKVWFAPSEVISQPLQSNPNWANSVITDLAGIGGHKDIEVSRASGSSTSASSSSDRHRVPKPTNGSMNPYPHGVNTEERTIENNNNHSQRDLELVNLLTGCLEAIRTSNIAAINRFIARTGALASPRGSTPMTRLISYYIEALALRVSRMWPHIFHVAPPPRTLEEEDDDHDALRFLNQVTPIPKFIHYTANEMLLRAFEGKERVHVIDFGIKQGLQWPSFFQTLASKPNPPRHVRITGVGESKHELDETGDRLRGFAEAMDLPFEFHPVIVDRLEDVRLWMLHVKEGEAVAVNCVSQMHKTLHDGTGAAFRSFVGLVRSTNPVAVVVAEQEGEHDSVQLEGRVFNSLKYYSAVFDVMHKHLGADSLVRVKIEEMVFGREIRNIVACEGSHRRERHVGFGQWRRMMEQLGFRSLGVREREVLQGRMLLRMYGEGDEGLFNVERSDEDGGGVTLRWLEQPLYTVSAWGIGGSSSF
ncbi:Scarecrow-like protein 28 [Raphanus sativus]|nr:Scarecrow-like protein 28 [Raphanus sativus]